MDQKQPTVHIICGFIGSGKTTFARKLEAETGAVRITKDEWMVRIFGNRVTSDPYFEKYDKQVSDLATDIAFRILKSGSDVILDEGFWTRLHRNVITERVVAAGAKPILYYVECPAEVMRERVIERNKNPPPDAFVISGEMFDAYLRFWEPPTEGEEYIPASELREITPE